MAALGQVRPRMFHPARGPPALHRIRLRAVFTELSRQAWTQTGHGHEWQLSTPRILCLHERTRWACIRKTSFARCRRASQQLHFRVAMCAAQWRAGEDAALRLLPAGVRGHVQTTIAWGADGRAQDAGQPELDQCDRQIKLAATMASPEAETGTPTTAALTPVSSRIRTRSQQCARALQGLTQKKENTPSGGTSDDYRRNRRA